MDTTWDLGDNYDPNEYYVGSTAKRGDGATLYTKTSAGVAASIAALVQSRTFPYRTNADFIRDAIVHRLHWCQEKGKVDMPIMRAEMAQSRVNTQNEYLLMITNTYKDCERGIMLARNEGDWVQVKEMVDLAYSIARDLKPPHDEKFRKLAEATEASFPATWSALLDERNSL